MGYTAYFDSGTTNSRLYLLREDLTLQDSKAIALGSRNTSISGSRDPLVNGLYALYQETLAANRITDQDVERIYASGTITTKGGLYEVPHVLIPIGFSDFAERIVPAYISEGFQREIWFVPGIRTAGSGIEAINHVRGEEIEALGASADNSSEGTMAIVLPGSHTHVIFVRGQAFVDILSTFTGELFAAVQKETTLAQELRFAGSEDLDEEMLGLGMKNGREYGLNRAIYMTLSMRVFSKGSGAQRAAYAQGVLLGGFVQALERKCGECHPDLTRVIVSGDRKLGILYQKLLNQSESLPQAELREKNDGWIPACEGLRYIIQRTKGRKKR